MVLQNLIFFEKLEKILRRLPFSTCAKTINAKRTKLLSLFQLFSDIILSYECNFLRLSQWTQDMLKFSNVEDLFVRVLNFWWSLQGLYMCSVQKVSSETMKMEQLSNTKTHGNFCVFFESLINPDFLIRAIDGYMIISMRFFTLLGLNNGKNVWFVFLWRQILAKWEVCIRILK